MDYSGRKILNSVISSFKRGKTEIKSVKFGGKINIIQRLEKSERYSTCTSKAFIIKRKKISSLWAPFLKIKLA